MNNLLKHFRKVHITSSSLFENSCILNTLQYRISQAGQAGFHNSAFLTTKWNKQNTGPTKWPLYNKVVHPPQKPDEEPRKGVIIQLA